MTKLYWAYGSNLNVRQMRERCPDAKVFGPLTVPNAILRFRGVADVAVLKGAECAGGLWEISERDEAALDLYEGVIATGKYLGLYSKKTFTAEVEGKKRKVLYYQMNEAGIMPPSQYYLDVIAQGYNDFGLDLERLERALAHAWNRKRKTPYLVGKWKRRGAPRLAREVNRATIPFEIEEKKAAVERPTTGLVRCQAPHCWELIDPETEVCPYCGAWQVQGRSKRYGLVKGGK